MAEKGLEGLRGRTNMTIDECSPQVRNLAITPELIDSLEAITLGLENNERVMTGLGRSYADYVGNEDRFSCHLESRTNEILAQKGYLPQDLYTENFFQKNFEDYAALYCGCNDLDVIAHFKEIIGHNVQYPDLIIHRPNNMLHQNCFVEVKFEGNPDIWSDFEKLTKFKNACHYLLPHVDNESVNPVFAFHIFIFLCRDLKEKINGSTAGKKTLLKGCNRDIVCIYKEDANFRCTTLGEILNELNI